MLHTHTHTPPPPACLAFPEHHQQPGSTRSPLAPCLAAPSPQGSSSRAEHPSRSTCPTRAGSSNSPQHQSVLPRLVRDLAATRLFAALPKSPPEAEISAGIPLLCECRTDLKAQPVPGRHWDGGSDGTVLLYIPSQVTYERRALLQSNCASKGWLLKWSWWSSCSAIGGAGGGGEAKNWMAQMARCFSNSFSVFIETWEDGR